MKINPWIKYLLILFLIFISLMYYIGGEYVPFHPDEATQIYTSRDFTQWIENPSSLALDFDDNMDDRALYRLIDAPLTRLLIGIGLNNSGLQPTSVDWDWSKTWQSNINTGALPDPSVLNTARWSVMWMFPLTLFFLFMLANKIGDWKTGLISVLLLSTNSLILLHTRRAMAESALICFVCFSLWMLMCVEKRVWLSAIPLAFAINSKQTALPLAGIGILHTLFQTKPQGKMRLKSLALFSGLIILISWLLNPVFWSSPVSALRQGLTNRVDLTGRMRLDYKSTSNLLVQTGGMIGQVFFADPAIQEVANYQKEINNQAETYFENPINNLFHGYGWGVFFLSLTIMGWILLIRRLVTRSSPDSYSPGIFLGITLVLGMSSVLLSPVPFQRYFLILIPLFVTAQALAINSMLEFLYKIIKKAA